MDVIVIAVILIIIGYTIITFFDSDRIAREAAIKKSDQFTKKRESSKTPKVTPAKKRLNLIESAAIAKEASSHFPTDDLLAVSDFLTGAAELRNSISLFNEKIESRYRDLVIAAYKEKGISGQESIDADLRQVMEVGVRGILKTQRIIDLHATNKDISNGSKIDKTHSWSELADEFLKK